MCRCHVFLFCILDDRLIYLLINLLQLKIVFLVQVLQLQTIVLVKVLHLHFIILVKIVDVNLWLAPVVNDQFLFWDNLIRIVLIHRLMILQKQIIRVQIVAAFEAVWCFRFILLSSIKRISFWNFKLFLLLNQTVVVIIKGKFVATFFLLFFLILDRFTLIFFVKLKFFIFNRIFINWISTAATLPTFLWFFTNRY